MTYTLSSIDLYHLCKELQFLINSRITRVYQINSHFFFTTSAKQNLHYIPNLIWISDSRPTAPEKITGQCAQLRKNIDGSRIIEITQHQRTIKITLTRATNKIYLFFELYGQGNLILTDENNKVIAALTRKNEKYTIEEKELFNTISFEKFTTGTEGIAKHIAKNYGVGGKYATEACIRNGINPQDTKPKQLRKIYDTLQSLYKSIQPAVIMKEGRPSDVTVTTLSNTEEQKTESLSKAVQRLFEEQPLKEDSRRIKIKKIIEEQTKQLENVQRESEELKKKGEYIYEHYTEIQSLIEELKKLNWEQIKKHPRVKKTDPKDKKAIVEI